MKQWKTVLAATAMFASAPGAEEIPLDLSPLDGQFEGRVVVEWLDDPFVPTMKLAEDFAYREASGKLWRAPRGQVLDGKGLPPLFRHLAGHPFEGGFRKASVLYDAATRQMINNWGDAQRMFYEASVAEGVFPADAKAMYAVLAAQGSRWEVKGSSCFGTCHGNGLPLEWRPVVNERKVGELVEWARANDPSLPEIEARAMKVIKAQGPHIFTQPECDDLFSGSTRIRKHCDDRR